jgi:phospholipid/cholesterol/gamma-HCH transport system substrate-binding protein
VTQGLTGLAYVELTGGSPSAPPLEPKPGEPPPVIQAGPSLVARLDDAFTQFQETFNTLSGRMETLLSPENQQAFSQILSNVSTITATVADRTGNLEQTLINLETTTNTLAAHSGNLGRAIDNAANALEASAQVASELNRLLVRIGVGTGAVEEMAKTITHTSKALVQTAEESRQQIFELAKNTTPELNTLLAQLNQLGYTLERFIEDLDRNPRMLLLGRPSGRPGPGE